jgi:hypothetical protein
MILQHLKYPIKNGKYELAENYIAIMSILNKLDLAKREIQLLAFATAFDDIGSKRRREEFVSLYDSSLATVGNIFTKLTKMEPALLVKEGKKMYINPALKLDFEKSLTLVIVMEHGNDEQAT